MNPLYKPSGKAKEYGDYAVNIYTGCPHRCYYCFAPGVLHRNREAFHTHVEPRPNIAEELRRQIMREGVTGETIHLCFTCDPYPTGHDTTATREVIQVIKETGNHVQILTKGDGSRDFDLLDSGDWYGITYTCAGSNQWYELLAPPMEEPKARATIERLAALQRAHNLGIRTWVSMEPVLNAKIALQFLRKHPDYIDRYKIGKLNYQPSDIDWAAFGREAEALCQELGLDYYIKDGLRAEMEKGD